MWFVEKGIDSWRSGGRWLGGWRKCGCLGAMLGVVVEAAAERLLRATLVVIWWWLVVEAIVVVVMVAWLALWLSGSDVGGGGGDVVGPKNHRKRKTRPQRITARLTRRIPSEHWWGNLSEHKLSGITDLGTFMVFCEFTQP